jgi:hypothetical protein
VSSRGSRVDVMETSKDWLGDDRSGGARRTRSWRMQIQAAVGSIAVVVSRELPEQPDQMALVDHDDVVQASRRRVPTNVSVTALASAFNCYWWGSSGTIPNHSSLPSADRAEVRAVRVRTHVGRASGLLPKAGNRSG